MHAPWGVTATGSWPGRHRLILPPGAAACLRCGWLAPTGDDAAATARAHTRDTTHPTAYRPVATTTTQSRTAGCS